MVALSFQKQFASPILAGTKQHTIRGERKRPILPGQTLQLYTGMRTRFCAKIGIAACKSVTGVTLDFKGDGRVCFGGTVYRSQDNLNQFAVSDGFANWLEMRAFWAKQHPDVQVFDGFIIRWANFVAAPGRLP